MGIQSATCIRQPIKWVNGHGASMAWFFCINPRSSAAKRRFE
jgi:hypothetical protein